jgi:hypothetical protein
MASPELWRDANGCYISSPEGMVGIYTASGIKTASTGGATATLDISGFFTLGKAESNSIVIRIANIGTNPALYALGAAGAAASYTDNTNMHLLPPNSVTFVRATSTQVAFYHQQVTGSNTIQVGVMV